MSLRSSRDRAVPIPSAFAITEPDPGDAMQPSPGFLWTPSGWSKARSTYAETIIAAADRTTGTSSPTTPTYEFTRAMFCLRINSISGTPNPDGSEGISIKLNLRGENTPQKTIAATGNVPGLFNAVGSYVVLVGPGVALAPLGPSAVVPPSNGNGVVGEYPAAVFPYPLPPKYTISTLHRPLGNSTLTWNYDLFALYSF